MMYQCIQVGKSEVSIEGKVSSEVSSGVSSGFFKILASVVNGEALIQMCIIRHALIYFIKYDRAKDKLLFGDCSMRYPKSPRFFHLVQKVASGE